MWQHISAYLGGCGVDADEIVKVGLFGAQFDHPSIALGDLSRIRTQVVEANHLLLHRKKSVHETKIDQQLNLST